QLASVYAAIANGGEWVEPHLVDHIAGRPPAKLKRRRILEPGVDAQLRTMLRGVVSDQGTARLAAIPGYAVAGKTGTAQKPGPNGYIPGAYVATFVGMVPASRPRLLVLVTIDEPHGQIYGGLVAAPAFEQLAPLALQYLEVPPALRLREADPSRVHSRPRWTWSASSQRSSRWRCSAAGLRCAISPTTRVQSVPVRSSSPFRGSGRTATTSLRRRWSAARSRSSSSAGSTFPCRRSSCLTRAPQWLPRRTSSSVSRP